MGSTVVVRGPSGEMHHIAPRFGVTARQEAAQWIRWGFIVLGTLSEDFPLVVPFRPRTDIAKPEHHPVTGACMCTSFKWNTYTGVCMVCGHESHGSRIHCGVIR